MRNSGGLLPYQIPAVEQLLAALRTNGAALDASDMGVGKTYAAGGVIRELNAPTLVVCPKVSITGWQRMGERLGVEFDIVNYEQLRTGKTPFGAWANPKTEASGKFLKCNSCQLVFDPAKPQPCPHHFAGIHCVETKTKPHNYGRFSFHPGVKLAVFDEAHRAGAVDSLNADMLIATRRQGIRALSLSATAADSPLGLRGLGYSLGLHKLADFYPWAMRHGCRKLPFGGFHFAVGEERKREILAGIHADIFPARGARVRIEDLGDAFPDCQVFAELCDMDAGGKIDAAYAEMAEAVERLNCAARNDVAADHPLTKILRARQRIELLKVPMLVELAQDAVAEGRSVALFVNFRETVDELCKRLKTNCRIDGSQVGPAGERQRRASMEDFLADRERIIVCTIAAGGISIDLHDIRGEFPRLGLISPGYSAREFRQVCGRLRRQGAKSKSIYRAIFAAGTVEAPVQKALAGKLNNLDALNDADLCAVNLSLCRNYLDRLSGV